MKTLNVLLALLALGATAATVLRGRTAASLRAEAAHANVQAEAAPALRPDNEGLAAEIASLREQTTDLPRLRNEVSQLRRSTNEIGALLRESAQLSQAKASGAPVPAPTPAGFTGKAQLVDMGFLTPDATVQTFFWAMRETNFARAVESWSSKMRAKEFGPDETKRARLEAEFAKGTVEMMRKFNNFGVLNREQISPNEQVLEIGSSFGSRGMKMRLVVEEGIWKIDKFE